MNILLGASFNHEDDDILGQGSENFFGKGSDSNYFQLCKPYSLCHNYSILSLQ